MGRCTLGRQSHLTPGRNKDKNLRKFNTSDLGMNEETMTRAFHHKVSILNQAYFDGANKDTWNWIQRNQEEAIRKYIDQV